MKNNRIKSIEELCKTIWIIEEKYNLLNYSFSGVKVWQGIRMQLYYDLAVKLNLFSQPHQKYGIKSGIKLLWSLFRSVTDRNPLFAFRRNNTLFIEHPRKFLLNEEYIDAYTTYYIQENFKNKKYYMLWEQPYLGEHKGKYANNRFYIDYIVIIARFAGSIISKLYCRPCPAKDFITGSIEREIYKTLGISLDLFKLFTKFVIKFKIEFFFYNFLLFLYRPKEIFLTVSYVYPALIAAAKNNNILVSEFQHGIISKFHLGYSYPGNSLNGLDYFPDRLLLWHDFWKNMADFPLCKDHLKIYPFKHMEHEKAKYSLKKKKNSILIVSQGSIGPDLASLIACNITYFNNKKVYYKLHPGEYDRWENYPGIESLKRRENFFFYGEKSPPLYQVLSEVETVIGVNSTVLFEALEFDCKLLLLNLPGVEYMEPLINNKIANYLF